MSSLTAAGKLRKSRFEDPTQCSGFSSAARTRRTPRLSQFWDIHPETRTEASEALRGLIDAIVLTPNHGELQIELKGDLAAMLGAAQNEKRSPETGDLSPQVVMVAGAYNQRYLQLCRVRRRASGGPELAPA